MLAITIAVAAFLIVGSLLVGSMLGWVLREYMMYHHDKQPTQPTMHPEMFDENGQVIPDEVLAVRFENDMVDPDDPLN